LNSWKRFEAQVTLRFTSDTNDPLQTSYETICFKEQFAHITILCKHKTVASNKLFVCWFFSF